MKYFNEDKTASESEELYGRLANIYKKEDFATREEFLTATKEWLKAQADAYLDVNKVPLVNYSISAEISNVSDIGDLIYVKHPKVNVNITTNVISIKYDVLKGKYTKIEFGNFKKEIKNFRQEIVEEVGKDMMYWIVLPADFDSTKKYPTLLFCEGGPQSPVSQFWSYRWNFQIMAANGYVIIAPNRRGLPGFGSEWNEEISGDWTGMCMKDYLSAIDDACNNLPFVDKDRLGAVGASFGGFSVYYLAGHHDKRFKCFIAHDGAFNLESMYTDTEEAWFSNWEYEDAFWNKDLSENAKKTYENSPHKFVDKWDTPILCIHGEKDYRINANQGMGAFNAARMRGIPAELLIYPDENIGTPTSFLLY